MQSRPVSPSSRLPRDVAGALAIEPAISSNKRITVVIRNWYLTVRIRQRIIVKCSLDAA
jgi:hypothetical protein